MQRNVKLKELKKWMQTANFQELNEKLYMISEKISDVRGEYELLRTEIIRRHKKGKAYKIKIKGNILALTRDDVNTLKLQKVVQSISYNTTHVYEVDETNNLETDEDYIAAHDSEPAVTVNKALTEISSDRLIFESLDYVLNNLWFVFRIDSKSGDYLCVDYTIDTGLYSGCIEVIKKKE